MKVAQRTRQNEEAERRLHLAIEELHRVYKDFPTSRAASHALAAIKNLGYTDHERELMTVGEAFAAGKGWPR
jgi:hypothetical protein